MYERMWEQRYVTARGCPVARSCKTLYTRIRVKPSVEEAPSPLSRGDRMHVAGKSRRIHQRRGGRVSV